MGVLNPPPPRPAHTRFFQRFTAGLEIVFVCTIQTCETFRLNQTLIEFSLDFLHVHVAIFLINKEELVV